MYNYVGLLSTYCLFTQLATTNRNIARGNETSVTFFKLTWITTYG